MRAIIILRKTEVGKPVTHVTTRTRKHPREAEERGCETNQLEKSRGRERRSMESKVNEWTHVCFWAASGAFEK